MGEGDGQVPAPLPLPRRRDRVPGARGASASTGRRSPSSWPASSPTRVYGIVQLGSAEVLGINLDQSLLSPITGGASQINIYGAIEGASVFRPNALTGDPNHLGIELVIPLLVLTPLYLRLERGHRLQGAARARARVPAPRRAGDAVALRPARPRRRAARARRPVPAPAARRREFLVPLGGRRGRARRSCSRPAGSSSSRCCARASTRRRTARRPTSTSTASSRTCSRRTRSSGSA